MTLIVVSPLTTDSDLDRKIAATHRGMAHWAGTGPDGTTCGACEHFTPQRNFLAEGKCEKVLPGAQQDARESTCLPSLDRELPALPSEGAS